MPRQVSGFSLQRLDDDVLLYHPGLTRTLHLNDTAALIWQLCDGTRAVDAIVHALQDAFPEHRRRHRAGRALDAAAARARRRDRVRMSERRVRSVLFADAQIHVEALGDEAVRLVALMFRDMDTPAQPGLGLVQIERDAQGVWTVGGHTTGGIHRPRRRRRGGRAAGCHLGGPCGGLPERAGAACGGRGERPGGRRASRQDRCWQNDRSPRTSCGAASRISPTN